VTGAYAPLAGVIADPDMATFVEEEGFDLGQTFGGHPVSCAAGVAAIDAYTDGPIENVQKLEPVVHERLQDLAATHDVVSDVRGRGFLWGVEFADPATGEPFHDPRVDDGDNPVSDVLATARERGVIFGGGRPSFQIIFAPPLITSRDEIDRALDVLEEAIHDVFN
jgi:taurine--2-oxoglutarate transaminase